MGLPFIKGFNFKQTKTMAKTEKTLPTIGDPERREEIKKILEELAATIKDEVAAAIEEIKNLFPHVEPVDGE